MLRNRSPTALLRVAAAAALLVHCGAFAYLYWLSGGCFCAVLGAGYPQHYASRAGWVFLRTVIRSGGWVTPFVPSDLEDRNAAVLVLLLNALTWTVILFLVLWGTRLWLGRSRRVIAGPLPPAIG